MGSTTVWPPPNLPENYKVSGVRMQSLLTFLVALAAFVSVTIAGGFQKKIFKYYAKKNLFSKCFGEENYDEFFERFIEAGKICKGMEPNEHRVPALKPIYIKPYPPPTLVNEVKPLPPHRQGYYHYHPYSPYNNQPFYHHPHQQPQYQQPQMGYQKPPQYYHQNQYGYDQRQQRPQKQFPVNVRSKRADDDADNKEVVPGEAEVYFYKKMKKMYGHSVSNMTCVMQQLGYLTEDNEVNFEQYREEYNKIDLPDAMKQEFLDNIDMCKELSECIPQRALEKHPFGRELGRTFMFIMCEKKTAAKVCLKKQMIDDYYKFKHLMDEDDADDDDDMLDMDDGGLF